MKLGFDLDEISEHLKKMADRAMLVDGWLNRVAYPSLLNVQRRRWQTEGQSEGVKWAPISSLEYKKRKLKKFADYPGAGRKLLIATARLGYSMTQDKYLRSEAARADDHYKIVSGSKLEMGTFVPYARYQEEQGRDITTLSEATKDGLSESLAEYIQSGKMNKLR